MASTFKRSRFRVNGIVQGVGFRPFVYQLARKLLLNGFVLNDGDGVIIEIEGDERLHKDFERALAGTAPPLSRIDAITIETIPCTREEGFAIRGSRQSASGTMVSPDMAICDACNAEMHDPSNRRYRYPFINCTDCGPRYSIMEALPYDRPATSMKRFVMCRVCTAEYKEPMDRRYHAEPISCHDCGPSLSLLDAGGDVCAKEEAAIEQASALIRQGEIVAIKGLGGFHLVCDAMSEEAVLRLRQRKHRPSKPLAVMFGDLESMKAAAELSEADERLLLCKERPIVLVTKKSGTLLAEAIAPGIDKIGFFLAYTPLHIRVLEQVGRPVVATSANLSDEPIIIDDERLLEKLGGVVSAILTHNREIVNACDDSVVMMAGTQKLLMRMARGYAPKSLPLQERTQKKILAVGANQKSTLALAFGEHLVLSPHIGDLGSLEAFEYFERTIDTFKRFYDFEPDIIVCDRHPGYETTKWALNRASGVGKKVEVIQVQHHYAHALACMAEYGLNERVLAFCFDGTGYGDDGSLWGGEVLIADPLKYERINHLRPFRLLGGEKAVREPRRVALSLLFECFSLDEILQMENPAAKSFTSEQLTTLHTMWKRGLNAPLSSSIGRLFDAVASLGGIAQVLGYEGESGLLIETAAAAEKDAEPFDYSIIGKVIDCTLMVREILACHSKEDIAARFMATLSRMILEIAEIHPELPVVLSGGVFQNRMLVADVSRELSRLGRRYYIQQETPVNDGGIALGQLYHALYRTKEK